MNTKNNKILIVLPAYNETGKVGRVVEKILATGSNDTILVVDDCSTDDTSGEAKNAGALVLRHEINKGVGAAIRTGIKYGIQNSYDICTVLSSDDQHEPKEIDSVVKLVVNNEFDFVQGSRRMKGGRVVNDRPFRKITTQLYSLLLSILVGKRITDATNGFRAFRLTMFDYPDINIDQEWLDRYELEPYILFKAITNKNIRFIEVPITIYYHQETKQYTKMRPFIDWWKLAKPLVYLGLRIKK
ncbi:MAG: glycosyltransferase family 2 protein [candidate division Zixibacteria bacterium]|nr:glycosyltransferase family 2 protein [candidate division Zixibacteria bacterium]